MTIKAFKTTEVAQITGLSVRQLNYWSSQKLVSPELKEANGQGSRRLYSIENLIQLQVIKTLRNHSWSIQKIRTAIDSLRVVMNASNPLKNMVLIHANGTIVALCKTKDGERIMLDALTNTGQQIMWIILEDLFEKTTEIIERDFIENGAI